MGGAVGHKRVAKEFLEDYHIPVPPLPEQRQIVSVLDEAFAGLGAMRANAEKNLQNARELFEAHLQAIFVYSHNWTRRRLKEVAVEFGRGKSRHRPRGDPSLLGGQYPLIQTGDIANVSHVISAYSQTYNDLGLAQSKLWPKGTICIAIVGANVGETAILGFDSCFPDSVIGVVVDERFANFEFVQFALRAFKSKMKQEGKGTARDNINIGTFENLRFPFPSLAVQRSIVKQLKELLAQVDVLSTTYERKLAAIDELKQSILQKAFAGELTAAAAVAA